MKKIDDFIKSNKELLSNEEPYEGHFERFDQKLNRQKKQAGKQIALKFFKAAVIAVLIALSAMWIYDNKIKTNQKSLYTLSDISPEYAEVENYYLNTINADYNQIKSFNFHDKMQKKMLLNELQEMDSLYISLQKDLKNNPTDQRIIDAMINHYQLKVELLQQIINQLKQINNQIITEKHENYKI